MFRIGISMGRNDLSVEGHLQMSYNSKTVKNYNKPVGTQPVGTQPVETQLAETQPVQTQPVQTQEEPPSGEEEE